MARMDFGFGFSNNPSAKKRAPEDPMRILILSDLSGRGTRPDERLGDLSNRKAIKIDIDEFDAVFERIAPKLAIQLENGPTLDIGFGELEDFHPDALYDRLELFAKLREMRKRLNDPSTFEEAAAELQGPVVDATAGAEPAPTEEPPAATEADSSESATGGSDFAQLLGGQVSSPADGPRTGATASGQAALGLDAFLRATVAPYVVQDPNPAQHSYVASVDQAITDQMRTLLHHPGFQRLESAWTAIRQIVNELETDEELQICVFDITEAELSADIAANREQLEGSAIHRQLVERTIGSNPWSFWVLDFEFGSTSEELQTLAAVGALASRGGGAVLGSASPRLLGLEHHRDAVDPKAWPEPDAELSSLWTAIRQSPMGAGICLAFPRILGRLPYGPGTEEIDRFQFEEMPPKRDHERYLWIDPAFGLARLLARSFTERGWAFEPGDHREIDGLPVHTFKDEDGESAMQACAELFLTERAVDAILSRGISSVASVRNRDVAIVPRIQAIADPPATLKGPWS